MVLMTCSRVPGPWFYLNAFAHVHYQSYPTRAITPMIICPARIQKHKIQYNNAMPFSPLGTPYWRRLCSHFTLCWVIVVFAPAHQFPHFPALSIDPTAILKLWRWRMGLEDGLWW